MKPKKSLGQHWLKDQTILQQITDQAQISREDVILEVGPGLGTLTDKLLAKSDNVIAVELDETLARNLSKNASKNLKVLNQDILDFDLESLPSGYKVIANIPYYLTSNLIRKFTNAANSPQLIVLLVQKEVSERIAAGPGNMSILAVAAQLDYEPELGVIVPAELFTPPPKVDSQVIIMRRRAEPLFKDMNNKKFFRLVKAGFSERRKKLRSSIAGGLGIEKTTAEELLKKAEIDPNARAQELVLSDWYELYKTTESIL